MTDQERKVIRDVWQELALLGEYELAAKLAELLKLTD